MGAIASNLMFPAPAPSYSLSSMASPPLYMVCGIPCLWFKVRRHRGIILYLHCNGVDLGTIRKPLFMLSRDTNYSVIAMEYPGYGIHTGTAGPDACVECARKVLRYIKENAPGHPVVIVGRSIGTGIAAELVVNSDVDGLVLVSPFQSIESMARPIMGRLAVLTSHVFNTKSNLRSIHVPTLLIHGDNDKMIPIDHSHALIKVSGARRKRLHVLKGCGHNDLDWHSIIKAINSFFIN